MSMSFAEIKKLSLARSQDLENEATSTITQGGMSFSRYCNTDDFIKEEKTYPHTPVSSSKLDADSAVYISIIEQLQAKVSALQNALLSTADRVAQNTHVDEKPLASEGHAARQLRDGWSRAIETNNTMNFMENISNMFTLNTFSEWSNMGFASPRDLETQHVQPTGVGQHATSTSPRHSQEDKRLHVEPVIFVDISSSAMCAQPPPQCLPCNCAEKNRLAEEEARRLRAALAAVQSKLDAALRDLESLRRERDEAVERAGAEVRRSESDGAAGWAEARRLELKLAQWSEKERELQRLRVLMRFSELKKDSDMLGAAATHLDEMEEERERLLEDCMRCRAQLAECRRQLREARDAAAHEVLRAPPQPAAAAALPMAPRPTAPEAAPKEDLSPERKANSKGRTKHRRHKRKLALPLRPMQEGKEKRHSSAVRPLSRTACTQERGCASSLSMLDNGAAHKKRH